MRRSGAQGLLGAACFLAACLLGSAGAAPPAGAATSRSAASSPRLTLPPGLSVPEHEALQRSGAYGRHPVKVLLLGDSIALTLGMGLAVHSRSAYGVTILDHATLGCDLDPGLPVMASGLPEDATQGCGLWRGLWPFLTAGERPQVVALGLGRWEVTDHLLNGRWVHIGQPAWDGHVAADLQAAITIFHTFGARVVLFTMPYIDPSDRQPDGLPWSENMPARTQAYNAVVRRVAHADPGVVSVIDLNRMLSPDGVYTGSVGGVEVRPDGIHISPAGGELLRRQILPIMDRIGMRDEAAARAHA